MDVYDRTDVEDFVQPLSLAVRECYLVLVVAQNEQPLRANGENKGVGERGRNRNLQPTDSESTTKNKWFQRFPKRLRQA